MSYTIEVYRGNQKAERNFGIYALYVMFYPQLVAGPIERPQNILHQFYEKHYFDYKRVTDGLKLMAWGLFKKVVIADRLAFVVDSVYNSPKSHHGLSVIITTIFFSYQIYCDFSGYTDMAIGAAKVMGFDLMKNFNNPYNSKSISEFWSKWHISLSTWFRDYLYIPLGGSRTTFFRWNLNLFIVFLISGLWHGANWTFIIWGAIHGCYLVLANVISKFKKKSNNGISSPKVKNKVNNWTETVFTFILVSFAWIFFRSSSMDTAFMLIKNSVTYIPGDIKDFLHHKIDYESYFGQLVSERSLIICFIEIVFLQCVLNLQSKTSINALFNRQPFLVRWTAYAIFVIVILTFTFPSTGQFIYFQF